MNTDPWYSDCERDALNEEFSDGFVRCPHHGEIISNGLFDAPCGGCEHEAEEAHHRFLAEEAEAERHAREGSPCSRGFEACTFRCSVQMAYCLMPVFFGDDEIPF